MELLRWQMSGYDQFHRSKLNLGIHIFAVPAFLCGNLVILEMLLRQSAMGVGLGFLVSIIAFLLQGIGHRQEKTPPIPFSSPANALGRIFLEQWITFPWFVLSGRWWKALSQK